MNTLLPDADARTHLSLADLLTLRRDVDLGARDVEWEDIAEAESRDEETDEKN